jgi:ABC-type transport system involved in cytochrome bd biosynthesis fused ATPase/permease subunit
MHIEPRLLVFTKGVRGRIAAAVGLGLFSVGMGVARLGLLGWLIGQVFAGKDPADLLWPIGLIALVMVLRGASEHWRAVTAHETAARVQKNLRRILYDKIASLGPATVGRQRSGAITLSMIDGVEQLETYFGQFLPQFMIALLSPILIFAVVAFIDLPVALVMLAFALLALFAPALWHKWDVRNSHHRQRSYAAFASEFLDSIQGLATLKAFGQGKTRADKLEVEARDLFKRTMWVLATNSLARGITDASIATGAATALIYGATRVQSGAMALSALLVIMMLGVEIFRPMRELRSVLHQGMVGLSAAQGIYKILDDTPAVADSLPVPLDKALAPTIAFEDVGFSYPGTRRTVHNGLSFRAEAGERLGLVGPSGGGKSSIVRLLLRFYDPDKGRITLGGHDLRTLVLRADPLADLGGEPGHVPVPRHGRREHPSRPARRLDRRRRGRRARRQYPRVHPRPAGRLQDDHRREGHQTLRRPAPAARDRARPPARHADPGARRGAERRRCRERGRHPGSARPADARPHDAHPRASSVQRDRLRPHPRARRRQGHGTGQACRADVARRRIRGLMAEQAHDSDGPRALQLAHERAGGSRSGRGASRKRPMTEGIIKAEGLTWYQVVAALMKVILPWKGKLAATFTFGVLRVISFIGVGVLSALIVLALKNGTPWHGLAIALLVVAPLSGVLHWFESWLAHDMAFRLLAEMRIDAFRKLDALAPAYLVRRRTGDLMALATHDIELVEYFFAHTVAPAFVAILVPAAVLIALGSNSPWLALALVPFLLAVGLSPFLMRKRVDTLGSKAREAAGELGAFAVDSVQGLGEIVAFQQESARGEKLDALSQRHISCACRSSASSRRSTRSSKC